MRASDADRDATADSLNRAFAYGQLTATEHDERLTTAMSATYIHELVPLTADLQPASPSPSDQVPAVPPPDSELIRSIMSTEARAGTWAVPAHTRTSIVMGDVKLDMRDAVFYQQYCEIDVFCVMGDLKISIPDGVQVIDKTSKIMADVKLSGLVPSEPNAPTIVLVGRVIMGDIKVYGSGHKNWVQKLGLG